MDRDQEQLRSLGFFGVFKESFQIIFSWKKIFTQITLSLILPLCSIFLAHIQISSLLSSKIHGNVDALDNIAGSGSYEYSKISHKLSSDVALYWLLKAAYFVLVFIFSLLSTSAVVYTVASIYTGKEITFKRVISVVPKVWKRLMVTFIWSFVIFVCYNFVAFVVLILGLALVGDSVIESIFVLVLLIVYVIGFVYITLVFNLASVVSVLENDYGIKALKKSKVLIKGKIWVSVCMLVMLTVFFAGIDFVFIKFVVFGSGHLHLGIRIIVGIVCAMFLLKVFLFGFVVQTVIYFVCKSYHHEEIDKSLLADHLECYHGGYVRLQRKNVPLEELHV